METRRDARACRGPRPRTGGPSGSAVPARRRGGPRPSPGAPDGGIPYLTEGDSSGLLPTAGPDVLVMQLSHPVQGEIMSPSGESRGRIQQMRDKAQELQAAAERAGDPEERKRLQEKARRLASQSEQESGMASGDIYPAE